MSNGGVVNLSRFILEEQRKHPGATGELTMIFDQIAFVAKVISREVNKAGLVNIIGIAGDSNVHGESQQKLDVYANERMVSSLEHLGVLAAMASEEVDDMITIPSKYPKGKYLVVFDPLDGSSNIDVNVSIGSIFGIYKHGGNGITIHDFCVPGCELIAAGYVIYGSSTMLVYSAGDGVNGFTLDPSVGEFLLSNRNIQMPEHGNIYSVNEANYDSWDEQTKKYIGFLKNHPDRKYTSRYIGSLVADFHRNLLKGGVYLYPADDMNNRGKIRLLYESNPLAFIAKNAGGDATTGTEKILNVPLDGLHAKSPLAIGSKYEVELYEHFLSSL